MAANEKQFGGAHYKNMVISPWDVIDTWPLAERVAYYRGNALKYLMRLNDKDTPVLNAQKAGHYVEKLIEVLSENEGPKPDDKFTVDLDGKRYPGVFPKICPHDEMNCTRDCGDWCKRVVGERWGD